MKFFFGMSILDRVPNARVVPHVPQTFTLSGAVVTAICRRFGEVHGLQT